MAKKERKIEHKDLKETLEDMNCALHSVDRVQIDKRQG